MDPDRLIRVVLVDDQTLIREGIRGLLALSSEIEVVADGEDGDDALRLVEFHHPDVLLLDLRMPRRDGLSVLEELSERDSATATLVLTTFDDDEMVFRAMRAGAKGFLLKDVTLDQLVGAIRELARGGTLWQPAVTERLLRAARGKPATVEGFDKPMPLTDRETDVLRLMVAGYSNREIAEAIHLAPGTIKNHVSNVLLKLGVRDRTRAVIRALELGLLES
jgi:DNA-binding NarL/FixJ family response regulator